MLIQLENIVKNYVAGGNVIPVLQDFNLTINPGDRIHLKGKNGAGKTTLLKIISGHILPDEGRIERKVDLCECALLSQSIPAYVGKNLTIAEHIAMGTIKSYGTLLTELLSKNRLDIVEKLLSEFCMGLEKRIDSYVGDLSGGEAQIIGLATVLALKPKILCLDEPSAALDHRVKSLVADMLRKYDRDAAIIFVAHDNDFGLKISNRGVDL